MTDKYSAYEIRTRTIHLDDKKDDNNMILAQARFLPFPSNTRHHQQQAVQPKIQEVAPYYTRWNYPFSSIGLTNVKAKPTILELHDTRKTNLELKHFTSANLALVSGKAKVKQPTTPNQPNHYHPYQPIQTNGLGPNGDHTVTWREEYDDIGTKHIYEARMAWRNYTDMNSFIHPG